MKILFMNTAPETTTKKKIVDIGTSLGHIIIELDEINAPKTVAHMSKMFESGHYLHAGLFRVGPGHVIQIGDTDCELIYRMPPNIYAEPEHVPSKHTKGMVSLNAPVAGEGTHSTFFINMTTNFQLDSAKEAKEDRFPSFGKVIEGMDILETMIKTRMSPSIDLSGTPSEEDCKKYPVVVTSILVTEIKAD